MMQQQRNNLLVRHRLAAPVHRADAVGIAVEHMAKIKLFSFHAMHHDLQAFGNGLRLAAVKAGMYILTHKGKLNIRTL